MITLLTGAPGHGKTYAAVRLIEESIAVGKPVATNVPLREDWPWVMARRRTLFGRWRRERVAEKAERYARLLHCTDDIDELLRVRFAGKGEGRGRIVLDEAHRWMNTRAWDQSPGMTRQDAIASRLRVVGHLSGHRHYGADVWLITQDEDNLDAQVRRLYEFHTEVRNFRRLPLVGAILRANIFLTVTRWNDRSKTKAGVNLYGLSRGLARLYDTHALEEKDWPADAIVLPRPDPPSLVIAGQPEQTAGERSEPRPAPPAPVHEAPEGRGGVAELLPGELPLPPIAGEVGGGE